jgi:DNA-binding CsgD family transcriptional regulator
MDIRESRETEIYHGWMKPHGWLHGCWAVIHSTESEFASLFATRGPEWPFEPEELLSVTPSRLIWPSPPGLSAVCRTKRHHRPLPARLPRDRNAGTLVSPAETRVALALLKGQTAAEYARLSGLSASTAKWYAQKVYQKAGVRRQTDLIRLLIERFRSQKRKNRRATQGRGRNGGGPPLYVAACCPTSGFTMQSKFYVRWTADPAFLAHFTERKINNLLVIKCLPQHNSPRLHRSIY